MPHVGVGVTTSRLDEARGRGEGARRGGEEQRRRERTRGRRVVSSGGQEVSGWWSNTRAEQECSQCWRVNLC